MVSFSVGAWSAWAPQLQDRAQWLQWAESPFLPIGEGFPALPEVPAMQRRRIVRLGRMAIQVALWCQSGPTDNPISSGSPHPDGAAGVELADCPTIFASRHGDVERAIELLDSLVAGESLSPASFSMSVHNAVGAQYSILRRWRGQYLAVASGMATPETACIEAAGLIATGASAVKVIYYDCPIPDEFSQYVDEPQAPFAWCWLITPPLLHGPGARVTLSWAAHEEEDGERAHPAPSAPSVLPHALDVHHFLLGGASAELKLRDGPKTWRWQKGALP